METIERPGTKDHFKLTCPKVNARQVLSERNVRWRKGDIGSLVDQYRDIVAYVVVGDMAYAVSRAIFTPQDDVSLYMFVSQTPLAIDLTELFTKDTWPGEILELNPVLRDILFAKIKEARQYIADTWAAALRKTPKELNLKGLLNLVANKTLPYCPPAAVEHVCVTLGERYWSHFGFHVGSLIGGKKLYHPSWAGVGAVNFDSFMRDDCGGRFWFVIKKGHYAGNVTGHLRIDLGPLAVVTAKSREGRTYCEKLIANGTYGDVILLIGEGAKLKREAQRLSDYLFGVDIINL